MYDLDEAVERDAEDWGVSRDTAKLYRNLRRDIESGHAKVVREQEDRLTELLREAVAEIETQNARLLIQLKHHEERVAILTSIAIVLALALISYFSRG